MTGLEEVLKRAGADLDAVGAKWAIIGGLAVATRAAPRFTQDVDFAVSVADDAEAEDIVHRMSVRGYALGMMLEQDYVHRLATIRLIRPVPGKSQGVTLIVERGFHRGRALEADLDTLVREGR